MNSNWFKLVMKMTKVEYGKNLLLKGVPIIFNKGGAKLKIGENTTIKSSFLSNLVGLYSRTIIVTRAPGAEIEIGDNVGISGACQYLFFAKIDESMKIHAGGGVNDEQIELMYLPIEQSDEFIFDESKAKTPGLMFSFYWFFKNIDKLEVK